LKRAVLGRSCLLDGFKEKGSVGFAEGTGIPVQCLLGQAESRLMSFGRKLTAPYQFEFFVESRGDR
jgi:hypothetical protein